MGSANGRGLPPTQGAGDGSMATPPAAVPLPPPLGDSKWELLPMQTLAGMRLLVRVTTERGIFVDTLMPDTVQQIVQQMQRLLPAVRSGLVLPDGS